MLVRSWACALRARAFLRAWACALRGCREPRRLRTGVPQMPEVGLKQPPLARTHAPTKWDTAPARALAHSPARPPACALAHWLTRTHAHTRTRTHSHTHAHTRTHTQTQTHTHTHTLTHTHTHTHGRAQVRCSFYTEIDLPLNALRSSYFAVYLADASTPQVPRATVRRPHAIDSLRVP